MGKIFYFMGKSSTGKDTIYRQILSDNKLKLRKIVPYTTRPIRANEEEGREYHFITEQDVERMQAEGRIIELRSYDTFHGTWKYMTVDDGRVKLDKHSYIMIGTLEAYQKVAEYYGEENVVPILIVVDDGIRLQRALNRERNQLTPRYQEMCRRFLADEEDYRKELLEQQNITKAFENENLEQCINEILDYMRENLK
ncbi:MAG: guanylate kinase [Lachnospiraceae bacterium]|nr:guanylate kinase [Lachnospiraceae bacterium]